MFFSFRFIAIILLALISSSTAWLWIEKRDIFLPNITNDKIVDLSKSNYPLINLDKVETMMNLSNQQREWQCIKKIIETLDLNNITVIIYNLTTQPKLTEIADCYTNDFWTYFQWIKFEDFEFKDSYYWIIVVSILGFAFLALLCKLCCVFCSNNED